ncbi:MAG: hypothetical protein MJ025_04100 [Victivallaceae bacterium]|nr:hypothetical protein [Victivallaceae bacterium]
MFGAIIASGCRPGIVGGDSLFYYYLGMFLSVRRQNFFKLLDRHLSWKQLIAISTISVVAMYFRYSGNPDPDVPMLVQLSSGLLLMKLSGIIVSSEKWLKVTAFLGEQSFFLYCSHAPMLLSFCGVIACEMVPDNAPSWISITVIFIVGIVDIVLCTLTGILLRRFCPWIFSILTGGRIATAK